MRYLWFYSFLAVMYVLLSWAAGAPQIAEAQEVRNEEESETSLLDTFSLSYGGNYYVSETIKQGRELTYAFVSALGALVDLRLVREVVGGVVDRLNTREGRSDLGPYDSQRRDRSDIDPDQEDVKEKITTLVGAALGEQECLQRSACIAGEYAAQLPGRDMIFIVLDRLAPTSWLDTLSTLKQSATYVQDCARFECSTDPEGRESDA